MNLVRELQYITYIDLKKLKHNDKYLLLKKLDCS